MIVLPIDPQKPDAARLAEAAEVLGAGGVVALPTETFYGLAVDASRPEALRRLNRIKDKPADSPILLLLASMDQVGMLTDEPPPLDFEELARRFWPGPLNLVIGAGAKVPEEVSGGRNTVAVRVSGLPLPCRLAACLGRPITGVSANRTGEPPSRTAQEVTVALGDEIDLILDGGPTSAGAPSTIVDLTGKRPRLLREGLLPRSALRTYLPDLEPE